MGPTRAWPLWNATADWRSTVRGPLNPPANTTLIHGLKENPLTIEYLQFKELHSDERHYLTSINVLEHISVLSSSQDYLSNFINSALYSRAAADSDHFPGPGHSHLPPHPPFVKTTPESEASQLSDNIPPSAYSSQPRSVFWEITPAPGCGRLLCFTLNTWLLRLLLLTMIMRMTRKTEKKEKKSGTQDKDSVWLVARVRWSGFLTIPKFQILKLSKARLEQ